MGLPADLMAGPVTRACRGAQDGGFTGADAGEYRFEIETLMRIETRSPFCTFFALAFALLTVGGCSSTVVGATGQQLEHAKSLGPTGALLYERNCQSCHGARGEGTRKVPPILGREVLSRSRFKTAQDLWDFVAREMPMDNPGGLDITQYWEIVTFMAASTGRRKLPDERLSESNADQVKLRSE